MRAIAWMGMTLLSSLFVAGTAGAQGAKPLKRCPADSVVSGTVCMDKYEASAWRVPDASGANKALVAKIQQGKATAADLTAGGAMQLGALMDDYAPCADGGQNCGDVYAVSLRARMPSANLTWFQARAACQNSRKRLPTNAEWQAAVADTPEGFAGDDGTTDCNTLVYGAALPTGSRSGCVSSDGAFDMVGNVYEWVADWVPRAMTCGDWSALGSLDHQCMAGAATTGEPGALVRGGSFQYGFADGPFAVGAIYGPSVFDDSVGFRCAR